MSDKENNNDINKNDSDKAIDIVPEQTNSNKKSSFKKKIYLFLLIIIIVVMAYLYIKINNKSEVQDANLKQSQSITKVVEPQVSLAKFEQNEKLLGQSRQKNQQLKTQISALQTKNLRLSNQLNDFKSRINSLQNAQKNNSNQPQEIQTQTIYDERSAKLIVASIDLKKAIYDSKYFERKIENLKKLAKGDEFILVNLESIRDASQNGVFNTKQLSEELEKLSNKINSKIPENISDYSFVDKLSFKLKNLITIKKVNSDVNKDIDNSILNLAKTNLKNDDVQAVANGLRKLSDINLVNAQYVIQMATNIAKKRRATDAIMQYTIGLVQ